MTNICSKKVEEKSINKINDLIEKIECAESNITKNDKNISWDGTINFYNGNIEKKENYQFSIDVQVKGRTIYKKNLGEKSFFDLSIVDLKNYLKKDGTILFVVEFQNNSDAFKIYSCCLLPSDILLKLNELENKSSQKTVRVKTKVVNNEYDLEKVCRNFQINKNIQKKMDENSLKPNFYLLGKNVTTRFTVWDNKKENLLPENLLGTLQYIYTLNEKEYPIAVSLGMLSDIARDLDITIKSPDEKTIYNDVKYVKSINSDSISFGKAFNINYKLMTFNIKIQGSLDERIKQLKFSINAIEEGYFYIKDFKFQFDNTQINYEDFRDLLNKYLVIKDFFLKHNIIDDVDLSMWNDDNFRELEIWINAIENNVPIRLKSDISLIGSKKICNIRLSIMATIQPDNSFMIESLWNGIKYNKYNFKHSCGDLEIVSNNLYLALLEECYLSDDINFEEMINIFKDYKFNDDEYILLNMQVLEILKAYDINKNIKLLNYAEYLTNILINNNLEKNEIYYINFCQILKRKNELTDEHYKKIMDIKNNSVDDLIILSCDILLDNKREINLILNNIDLESKKMYLDYPISIFLDKE